MKPVARLVACVFWKPYVLYDTCITLLTDVTGISFAFIGFSLTFYETGLFCFH